MKNITCPHCGAQLNAPDELLGKAVACGACRRQFIAADAAPTSAQALSTAPGPLPAPPGPVSPSPWPYGQPMAGAYPQKTSGMAVASLVLGIGSIPLCILWGVPTLVCGILALVFASSARRDVEAGLAAPSSLGMARAGRICAIVGLVLAVAFWAIMIVAFLIGFGLHDAGF